LRILETLSATLGFLLLGACFISVGILISASTGSQSVAAVGTFAVLLVFWLLEPIKSALPQDAAAGIIFASVLACLLAYALYSTTKSMVLAATALAVLGSVLALCAILRSSLFQGLVVLVLGWFSLLRRQESFTLGLLKLDNIVYYLSFIFAFLFLSLRLLEKRRWM
jgi:ABC-2 type transport system permease protein